MTPQESAIDRSALDDVGRFLRLALPADALSDEQHQFALNALRVAYHARGSQLGNDGSLRIIRSGAVELRDGQHRLLGRFGEGDSFHLEGSPDDAAATRTRPGAAGRVEDTAADVVAEVIEDALIYRLPADGFRALCAASRAFDRHFTSQRDRRLRRAARYQPEAPGYLSPVRDVMARDLVTVAPGSMIREAAAAMAARRVSSILVIDDGRLVGIVTDRDLRTRVLAADLPSQLPIREIMTPAPATITADATLFDATLEMTRRGVHHLPLLDDGERLVGMVTTSDLITARQEDPVYLVQRISRAGDVREIAALAPEARQLLRHALTGGMQPQPVSKLLTAVSDAVLRRLVALAEEELGSAPAPWAWLAFGSQARAEQLLGADQDNGIVIDDAASDGDLAWYESLAGRVCDGLAACGYAYCPGGIMATSDDCRLRLGQWRQRVRRWAQTPTAEALMRVGIFFDLRAVHGEATLARDLQQEMLAQGARNTIFLAALAASVLENRPPLGVFRRFVVERDGEHRDHLDIKKRGVLPVTEIARLHALAHGIAAVNTDDRLRELSRAGHLSVATARNLADALHCVQRVRMRHQAEQVGAGADPDNFVDPRALPRLAREALRDAFTVIDEAQAGVRQSYRAGFA